MAKKIMLDAGHYGKYNRSDHVPEYAEAERMWVLMRLLQMKLEKMGYIVHSTRDEEAKDITLFDRGLESKDHDLFVSLHSNDFEGSEDLEQAKKVDYVSVCVPSYSLNERCYNSEKIARKIAEVVKTEIGSKQDYKVFIKLQSNGDEWYGVLRGWQKSNCPLGFIIEHGFHSNPTTARWLMSDENLMSLAEQEANAIREFLEGETIEKNELKAGSIVKVKSGAKVYNSSRTFASFVYDKKWIVSSLKDKRAVIDKSTDGKHSIQSPVNADDLIII